MKNTFSPINQIPGGVLSLIPNYRDTDKELIVLTHVCRGWRERFISCCSLWTSLDCTNVERTHIYLDRAKTSPLEISLGEGDCAPFLNDAFLLTVPHLGRLNSLALSGSSDNLLQLVKYFGTPAPLLKKLNLTFTCTTTSVLQGKIFDGSLSSLRELRLSGVIADLAWGNMSSLKTFVLCQIQGDKVSVTQLLNFFERAPLLRKIRLEHAFPNSSDAPRGRVVSLPHLEFLTIVAQPAHTILLNHLSIPAGAGLSQGFNFNDDKSPIPIYLPKTPNNLKSVSRITSINLSFNSGMSLRLNGPPSGTHYVQGGWVGESPSLPILDRRVLQSLSLFGISAVERLAIAECKASSSTKTEKSPVYLTLLSMNNLRTLTLTHCVNFPFILALNPGRNPSRTVVCPGLEELVLYTVSKASFCMKELLEMVKERASSGAKLSAVTIVCSQEFAPAKEVLKIREYVTRVEYRLDDVVPDWDILPTDADDTDYESDW